MGIKEFSFAKQFPIHCIQNRLKHIRALSEGNGCKAADMIIEEFELKEPKFRFSIFVYANSNDDERFAEFINNLLIGNYVEPQ